MLKVGNFNVTLQTITITNEGHKTDISHVFCFFFFIWDQFENLILLINRILPKLIIKFDYKVSVRNIYIENINFSG